MMRVKNFLFPVSGALCIYLFCMSCSGDQLVIPADDGNLLPNGNIEDGSAVSSQWIVDGDGSVTADTAGAYDGNNSLHFNASDCLQVFSSSAISITSYATYCLSFAINMQGSGTGCAGDFICTLHQGSQVILNFNIEHADVEGWVTKTYYFTPVSGDALTFDFIIGISSLWLDDVQIMQMPG